MDDAPQVRHSEIMPGPTERSGRRSGYASTVRKLWGGAFSADSQPLVNEFGQSIASDLTFWREDVEGSIAHARMLGACGIVTAEESQALVAGLQQILDDGPDQLPTDVEDIHTAVETRLHETIGAVAGKLHTARSRNDQVATDAKLHFRRRLSQTADHLKHLQRAILNSAEANTETVFPGVTHQQHAQPISLAFHNIAVFAELQRHGWRIEQIQRILATCPLGSAALAGTAFPIDRTATANELGFAGPTLNALDATSDRSYVLDILHVCALIMIDLGRFSQELISWSAPEFGYIALADDVTTGSSIMPQKRNPDMAELIRGRSSRAVANWVSLATTMKGLVHGYNRDTQDDKPAVFESLRLVNQSLQLMTAMVSGMTVNQTSMLAATKGDFSTATDIADALARSGIPFREAHEVVGKIVRHCIDRGIGLEDLTPPDLELIQPALPPGISECVDPIKSTRSRNSFGGTGDIAVREQIEICRRLLEAPGFARPDHLP